MKYAHVSKLDLASKLNYNNREDTCNLSLPLSIRKPKHLVQESGDFEPTLPIFNANASVKSKEKPTIHIRPKIHSKPPDILKAIAKKPMLHLKSALNEPNSLLNQRSNIAIEVPRNEVKRSAASSVFTYVGQKHCGNRFNFHRLGKKRERSNDGAYFTRQMCAGEKGRYDARLIYARKKGLGRKADGERGESLANTSNSNSLSNSLIAEARKHKVSTLNHSPLKLFQGNETVVHNSRLHRYLPKVKDSMLLKKIKNKFERHNGNVSHSMENQKPYLSGETLARACDSYVCSNVGTYTTIHTRANSKEKGKFSFNVRNPKLKELGDVKVRVKLDGGEVEDCYELGCTNLLQLKKNCKNIANGYSSTKTVIKSLLNQKTSSHSIENEMKLDKNREKERMEISKLIRLHWKNKGEAPKTELRFYKIGKGLGRGAFGKVNLAIHKLSGKLVAIKSINKKIMTDDKSKGKVLREVSVWEQLRNKNVIRLYEAFESALYLHYVEEFCAGGDLLTYVRKHKKLKESAAKFILKQVLNGLHYCHSKRILHRDIKLDNILITKESVIKICDFGVSRVVKEGEVVVEKCGTPVYIAPEILSKKGYEGFAADVWSAGVLLYIMIYGLVPFKGNSVSELQTKIIRGEYVLGNSVTESARDLLRRMLETNPKKRISIPQILYHRWFADYSPSVGLFTSEEKADLEGDFDYRKLQGTESDWFVEETLNSQSGLAQNATSKSLILAPFNTCNSNSLGGEQKLEDRKVLKLRARAKDADKEYERNNNCEVDNGIYNYSSQESEDSLYCLAEPLHGNNVQRTLLDSLTQKDLPISICNNNT